MKKSYLTPKFKHMLHGGDYNPDQWQQYPEILKDDMRLMQAANCNEMSVGIFAWATLEPQEGVYDFSFLDKALDDIYAAGGRVLLATPSGARPVWMAKKYEEVLRMDKNFHRNRFGARHNHCMTSPIYRQKTAAINRKLAERYKDHPALIGWHLSNEYGGECYCPLCAEAFRTWLKKKYGTIETLNHEWWSYFWSHTYRDFGEIDPPSYRGDMSTLPHRLDWQRFTSDQIIDFMKMERDAVKEFTPDIPVTTNLMGFYEGIDYRALAREVDFVSLDSYPAWKGDDADDITQAIKTGLVMDLNRSLCHRPFLLMESTPSIVNWREYNKLKRPGMHELSSLQAVAHGSDSVQYFQWRKSRGGFEKFHGAVVDHEGSENTRVFREVSALGARLKKLDEVVGTVGDAKAAIMIDWENRWALKLARGFQQEDKKVIATVEKWYAPFWKRGVDVDIICEQDDLSGYSLLVAPMLYMVKPALGEKLKKYVENGGTLVCTYMTGMVGENDLCHLGGYPGAGLREVFGIWNEEIDTLYPDESNEVLLADGETVRAVDYCELIHAEGAEVLATYNSDFYAGMPAVTCNRYGAGKAYYVAFRDRGDYADRFLAALLRECGITSAFDEALPEGVTAHSRVGDGERYVFLQNFSRTAQTLSTQMNWVAVEDGAPLEQMFTLAPYETKILKMK